MLYKPYQNINIKFVELASWGHCFDSGLSVFSRAAVYRCWEGGVRYHHHNKNNFLYCLMIPHHKYYNTNFNNKKSCHSLQQINSTLNYTMLLLISSLLPLLTVTHLLPCKILPPQLMSVIIVENASIDHLIWADTCVLILGKNLLNVPFALILPVLKRISSLIFC